MAITQTTILPLQYGSFTIRYHKTSAGDCVSVALDGRAAQIPIVRIHSSCLFGEAFHGLDCDCAAQLSSTLKLIARNGAGALIYTYAEGRGIGLESKIKALELQRTKGLNTVEAFRELGFQPDLRTYEAEIQALRDLNISRSVKVAGQNPHKLAALRAGGYEIIEQLHPKIEVNTHNRKELLTKKHYMGYDTLELADESV